jgi:hypothetical protein
VISPALTETKTIGTRLTLSGMGAILVAVGVFFTYRLWDSYERGMETRHWLETPCEIISSQVNTEKPVPNTPDEYKPVVRYRYELNQTIYHGGQIRRGLGYSTDRASAEAWCTKYPLGKKTACFVNPQQPDQSVLEHTSVAAIYSIWFPILFVAGGFGMILNAWRDKRTRRLPLKG